MKIIELSETGLALPDAEVDQFASAVLFQKSDFNIVVSNFLVILALRAKLFAIEVDKRPKISNNLFPNLGEAFIYPFINVSIKDIVIASLFPRCKLSMFINKAFLF